jgi:hypothetical protein
MASTAQITITVSSTRGASTISYRTKGRYVSFTTAGLAETLNREPIQPTSSLSAFWLSVLGAVESNITAEAG